MLRVRASFVLCGLVLAAGCNSAGSDDLGVPPGGGKDAEPRIDGTVLDSGMPVPDTGVDSGPPDTGVVEDVGFADSGPPDTGAPLLASLTITPTSATLQSLNGSRPRVRFDVVEHWSDGSSRPAMNAAFEVDPATLGTFSSSTSVFTASGRVGGVGRLRANVQGHIAEAQLRVQIQQVILETGTPTTAPMLFQVPPITDPARAADVVYPLDRAVMPQNVAPAEIQWLNGAPNDIFRVRLVKPNVRVEAFVLLNAPTNSWTVALDAWRRIAQSEPAAWAEIFVERWEAATQAVIGSPPVRVRFQRAALTGSIYYWDIVAGRIIRINDGTLARESFMPSPPQSCVGCHSVSPSGRYMAGRYGGGDNFGSVVDLTLNLTTNPPPQLFPSNQTTWWFSTWSPDEQRLAVSRNEGIGGQLALMNPFTGALVTPMAGTLPAGITHPAWAPDNSAIAVVSEANAWGGDYTRGNISLVPITGQDMFGPMRRVVTATAVANTIPNATALSYPSWSPDAMHIAFAHGNSSRSETGLSALYLMRADGSNIVRLDNASDGPMGRVAFQPRFSPFQQDGYYWMTFLSRRDYGNARAGTRGTSRQQLWVTAIKVGAQPGEDASEVPYWLPGQNSQSLNISAFWAPRACRDLTETCTVDAECCSGECDDGGTGMGGTCVPITMCRSLGEPCTESAQCCNNQLCVDSVCGTL